VQGQGHVEVVQGEGHVEVVQGEGHVEFVQGSDKVTLHVMYIDHSLLLKVS